MNKDIKVFVPVTLGMLTAFGPFVTDFYLPVLPEMAAFFNTSPALASMSLTMGMVGLAVGQAFIGPLTDKFGRKHILVASMLLFAVASVLCIFSPDIVVFNAMRLLQGVAGAGGIVISKSMATDMYSGKELADFMAVLGAINGVAPVCAPVIGGVMAGVSSWQGVFALLLAVGVVLMVCSACLRETLAPERRIRKSLFSLYANLFRVFRNRVFTLSTLAMTSCFLAFFGYLASSPYVLQQEYGMSPLEFSLCFGFNAVMICAGTLLATRIKQRTALRNGAAGILVASILLFFCLTNRLPLWTVMASYVVLMVYFGFLQPGLTSIALESERRNAGAASAMFGAVGFVAGAVASPLVAIGNIRVTSPSVMIVGAVLCLAFILQLCKRLPKGEF